MASQFQHRLVGTLVLISIGVIFLPDVLDGEKTHYQETFQAIPLQPIIEPNLDAELILAPVGSDINESDEDETDLIGDLISTLSKKDNQQNDKPHDLVLSAEKKPQPEATRHALKETPLTTIPTLDEVAWIIRLATFKNSAYAENLVDSLRKQGFSAQMSPRAPKEGQLVRVEVGPELSRQKLANMIKELESITGLKGQLIRFDPLKS